MTPTIQRSLCLAGVAAMAAACSSVQPIAPPDLPVELRAPAGQTLYLEALASGVQIYECVQSGDAKYEWAFRAPEASLSDRSGKSIGKHYAGPTWESTDGSKVVGDVKARAPGPTATAIPWLLLAAKANSGTGTFGNTASIQRVATTGGLAPTETCTAGNLRQSARVSYTATYYFYR